MEWNMKPKTHPILRLFVSLASIAAGSACILQMAAGPIATTRVIVVTATGGSESWIQPTASPTVESQVPPTASPTTEPTLAFTLAPTETLTPEPTATATTAPVTMTAGQTLSCVKGPQWILYEWVASIAEGETVNLLARSAPEGEECYYVRKSNGTEYWAFGVSSSKGGDFASLPVREAPALPMITLTIENKMFLNIADIFIRGGAETVWGADRLGAGVINPQSAFNLNLTAGFYDVMIKDDHGGILYEKYDSAIGSEAGSRIIVLANRYPLNVHSDATTPFCRVSLTLPDDSKVNLTIPGDGIIAPGEDVALEALAGDYPIRFFKCGDESSTFALSHAYFYPAPSTMVLH
jgi:hypothetical protein